MLRVLRVLQMYIYDSKGFLVVAPLLTVLVGRCYKSCRYYMLFLLEMAAIDPNLLVSLKQ